MIDSRVFYKLNKQKLISLKAKIKGLAEESRKTRTLIHEAFGSKRDYLWKIKRSIGQEARYHLLAYSLLRGIPYDKIESNSNKYMRNYLDYDYLASICKHHYCFGSFWTGQNIRTLIETGIMPKKVSLKKVSL